MESWYDSALKYDVAKDLENNPLLIKELGTYVKKFITWCSIQRVSFEADINDEVNEFKEKYINNRLYNTDVKLWNKMSKKVFERDHFTCSYCGKTGGVLEIDHIVPISKGGSNELNNLTTSCRKCNRQKKDKTVQEFKEWRKDHE